MNINLPANIENVSDEDVMLATGQDSGQSGLALPSLRINYNDEDEDGNRLPKGSWVINVDGTPVYAEEVIVRIMFVTHQYGHYDTDAQKQVATSVHFQNWSSEIPDDTGGFRCGKVSKDTLDTLSAAEQKVQKDIKLSRVCFCLVDIDGADKDGNKVSAENIPAVFYARGTNFMPITDYLKSLTRQKFLMQRVKTKFTTIRKKNGSLIYYEVVPEVSEMVETLSKEDIEIIQDAAEAASSENEKIMKKHYKATGGKPEVVEKAKDILEKIISDDDDLNDELPANLGG